MKGVVVKCPECQAPLEAGAETREVRCSYCSTLVVIQRRTRILQRPEPLPPRPPDAPAAQVVTESSEVVGLLAVVAASIGIVALAALLPTLLCNTNTATPWSATVLADVDGDETLDIVALMRDTETKALSLAAFAGQSGKNLWWSDEWPEGEMTHSNVRRAGLRSPSPCGSGSWSTSSSSPGCLHLSIWWSCGGTGSVWTPPGSSSPS